MALAALLAGSLFTLAPAHADEHPDDIQLILSVDDSDGIIAPGSEFTVSAELRFTDPHTLWRRLSIGDAALHMSGPLKWEASGRGALRPDDQTVMGGALYRPTGTDGEPVGTTAQVIALGLHRRTLLARSNDQELYVFDVWNKQQAAVLTPPATADGSSFGRPPGDGGGWQSHGGAVWHESDATAWLFIGSNGDEIGGVDNVGSLYIFKLDWRETPPSITLVKRLVPPQSEFGNRRGTADPRYGSTVDISADGGTLAVSAQLMNNLGAVYVYTRPDGAGEDWSDLEYAAGVKLSAAPAPAWGASGTRPFDPDVLAECDAYCSRVSSLIEDGDALFGTYTIGLSEDGRVISVAASRKRYPFDTAGGMFGGGTANVGEAYVFVAPAGGWQAAPEASGELIGAGEDASNFDPEMHYSPGPARRITAPAAVLLARRWADATVNNRYFGQQTAVSADGSTIAASEGGANSVHIFQRDSADDWAGELLPSATISGGSVGYGAWGGLAFNRDASVLLIGNSGHAAGGQLRSGAVDFLTRPASGTWADAAASTTVRLVAPTPVDQGHFGQYTVMDLDYERLAFSHPMLAGSRPHLMGVYLSDGNCTVRIVDDVSATTCPITLADGKVVIPAGSREGTHTVSGQVALSVDGVADSEVVLRGAIEVTIGEVQELAEVKLGFATDDRNTTTTDDDAPYPAAITDGQSTTLRLQLLNEHGAPSEAGSAASVLVTTTAGELSTAFGSGCRGGAQAGGRSCSLDTAALTDANSGRILLDLRHAGTAAVAELRATVFSADGETFRAEPLTVTLTGPPAALNISAPATGLLNVDTADEGEDKDDRDLLTLSVSAADANGAWVAVPGSAPFASLTGPDGSRVTRGVALDWPLLDDAGEVLLDSERNRQVRINVNRGAGDPLANGEYTLSVRSGGLTATQTFSVSGGAARVELSEPSAAPAIGEQFTITATIRDAEGAAVPNGTRVRWEGNAVGETPVLVQIGAEIVTSDGQASSTWLGVDTGRAHIRATADSVTEVQLLNIAASQSAPAAATTPRRLADSLSAPTPGTLVSWLGATGTTASALLADLDGVGAILGWRNGAWLSYSVAGGRPIPGSTDFAIRLGDVLWLGE